MTWRLRTADLVSRGEPILVGVDAGSTHSAALAVAPDGRTIGRAAGDGANPKRQGLDLAADRIAAVATIAAGRRPVALVLVAGAGIDRPENAASLRDALTGRAAARQMIVVNDTLAALRAGTPNAVGLVVVAGTGGNVIGRNADGRVTDRGHGVFGGSYALAALAIRAAERGDARVSPGLAQAVASGWPVTWAGRRPPRPGPEVAAMAPALLAAGEAGDALVARIVDRWCAHVTTAVWEEAQGLGLGASPAVVLYGGLLEASPWLSGRLRAAILAGSPAARIERLAAEPVEGAALLARDAWAGRPVRWEFTPRR